MDETERAFSLKLRPSATLKKKNFAWRKNFGYWKDKSRVRRHQKTVRNKQLHVSNGGATAARIVTLFVENHTWCQARTKTNSFDSRHSPTACQHVPLTSPLNTLGFSCDASFRFCPPPCWSRWRWRVVSERLITVMSPSAFPINYAAVIWLYTVNCWQWADEIQTPPGSGVYPGLSSGKVKVQHWICIMDQPLTPFIMKLHRLRDASYISWAFRLQHRLHSFISE